MDDNGLLKQSYTRYLRILGLSGVPTGVDGLEELTRRHLLRVPFENLSKLLLVSRENRERIPTLDEFLDGVEHYDLGGTCYLSNPFLNELLNALGYDARLLGADMATPDVHIVIAVAGRYIDVGYAAPFAAPICLGNLPAEIAQGRLRYLLRPNSSGDYDLTVTDEGTIVHGYSVHGPPRSIDYFHHTILDSYRPGRTFMTQLRISRYFREHTIDLRNHAVTVARGSAQRQWSVTTVAELERVVHDDFAMPKCPVREAVDALERLTGVRWVDIGTASM